jgi:hypothetical protein
MSETLQVMVDVRQCEFYLICTRKRLCHFEATTQHLSRGTEVNHEQLSIVYFYAEITLKTRIRSINVNHYSAAFRCL